MTNVSAYPISVDGVRLDTLAIGVEASAQTLGGLRSADQVLAGLDGEVPALHDSREPGYLELNMMVRGVDDDGLVPAGVAGQTLYQSNLDTLRHLLCQQGSLREVRRVITPASMPAGTNHLTNPTFGVGVTGWSATAGAAITRTLAQKHSGVASLQVVTTGAAASEGAYYDPTPLTGFVASDTVIVSAWIKGPVGTSLQFVANAIGAGAITWEATHICSGNWDRVVSAPIPVSGGFNPYLVVRTSAAQAVTFYVDDAMICRTVMDYFDGDFPGSRWAGVAHASASIRDTSDLVAVAKVVDSITPTDYPGDYGRLSARLKLTEGYWRSPEAVVWSSGAVVSGVAVEIPTLTGSTAPVEDVITCLTGPANAGVSIVDDATGFGVALTEALPAGQVWRVNSGTWESRVGAGLTVDSADTAGTNKDGVTSWSGTYPRYLRLHPRVIAGRRVVRVRVIGAGFTGATVLAAKGRRAYL